MICNFNDRTHMRLLDLSSTSDDRTCCSKRSASLTGVAHRNTSDAIRNLQEQLRASMTCLPQLVKEGLARSCAMAGSSAASSDRTARVGWTLEHRPH